MKNGASKNLRDVVGMSGGEDSSEAATLFKQAGFDVIGIMMKFWSASSADKKDINRCCSVESEKLARLVAKHLKIPFYVLNVEKEFKKKVVDYFLTEYKKGNTPNPCVVCNKEIKFGFLIKKALSLGADFVAAGHYARLRQGFGGQARLLRGEDKKKDQSYFLWKLSQSQLKHILFPVGGYTKSEVRKLAKKFKLPTAETPESQEVCFVRDTTNNFLKKYLKTKPGKIINTAGKKIAKHNGLSFYTIGQRRGIEIQQGPWYVVDKNFNKNILIVSKDKKDLAKKELIAENVNWIVPQKLSRQGRGSSMAAPSGPINAEVKIRYKSDFAKAKISKHGKSPSAGSGQVKVIFQKKQRAITPGQSAVFYLPRRSSGAKAGGGKELLGGGVIR